MREGQGAGGWGVTLLGKVSFELVDYICVPHKRQGIVVHPDIDAKLKVQPILVCDCWQICALPPDVQVSPAGAWSHCITEALLGVSKIVAKVLTDPEQSI